jgi:hypothetical protein
MLLKNHSLRVSLKDEMIAKNSEKTATPEKAQEKFSGEIFGSAKKQRP